MLRLSTDLSDPAVRRYQGREEIFDPCRRKWVALTPEEWVRQRLVQQFIEVIQVPSGWISIEKEIEVNGLRKRYDLLIYNSAGDPWLMAECKAPELAVGSTVMEQLLRYHISMPVPYLLISNATETRCWQRVSDELIELSSWPVLDK
ncbi:MAG: hypothetical protein RL750_143 [Bacteroidota bacterium]|jgi:hypothetical protein